MRETEQRGRETDRAERETDRETNRETDRQTDDRQIKTKWIFLEWIDVCILHTFYPKQLVLLFIYLFVCLFINNFLVKKLHILYIYIYIYIYYKKN